MSVAVKISIADVSAEGLAREPRSRVLVGATVRASNTFPIDATIHDVSRSGCLVAMDEKMHVGDAISIGISGIGQVEALVLRSEGKLYGCQFMQLIPSKLVDAVQSADTVVSFTGQSFANPIAFENSMSEPGRWLPVVRLGVLVAGSLACWGGLMGIYNLL